MPAPAADLGICRVGLVVSHGESCKYSGSSHVTSADDHSLVGSDTFIGFGWQISVTATVNGRSESFVARRQDEGERSREMDRPEFVDAHVHFYDMQHPELFYAHWQPDVIHPSLGTQPRKLAERNWLAEDFIALTRAANVTKVVHVQAAIGSKDPVKETEWLQDAADRTGFPHAIAAYADLRDPNVEAVIERHCEFRNMRGIRDFSYGDYLASPDFHRGFALMEKYGLIASIAAGREDMQKLRDLAAMFPNVPIVIDHAGLPSQRTPEYFALWRSGMESAAQAENVICKISGLGMGDNSWTVDSIRPYVLQCIETFGIERSLFATNWPVDSLWSSYDAILSAYDQITSDFTQDERAALFSRNTERLYRI